MQTDTPILPKGITRTPQGGYRVRVNRAGQPHILPLMHDLETAQAALATLLESVGPPRPKRVPRIACPMERERDHQRQVEESGSPDPMRNIFRTKTGYRVGIFRNNTFVYGGHFSGPDGLNRAIVRRDELEEGNPGVQPIDKKAWVREHRLQASKLKRRNVTRNISQTGLQSYRVGLRRGEQYVSGGHFSGPDALARAVARRDELEAAYPKTH